MPSTSASDWSDAAGRFRRRIGIRAVSPFAVAASLVAVLLGAAAAAAQGSLAPVPFAATLVAAGAIGSAVQIRTLPAAVVAIVFGPLMALGAYYVQTATFDLVPLLYAIPAGCLAAALCGAPRRGLAIAAYLLLALGVAAGTFVRWAALPLPTAPLAWALVRRTAAPGMPKATVPEAAGARVYFVFGLLLAAGILL
ncbi:MAG TPA: hypothetical protein VGX97_02260 [bacterium]|nr:hypothetical protein [bacterium]